MAGGSAPLADRDLTMMHAITFYGNSVDRQRGQLQPNFPRTEIVLLTPHRPQAKIANGSENGVALDPSSLLPLPGPVPPARFPEFGSNAVAAPSHKLLPFLLRAPHIEYFNFSQISFSQVPFYQVLPRGGEVTGRERLLLLAKEKQADGFLSMKRLHLMALFAGEGVRNIVGGSPGGRKDKSERMMTFSKLAKEEKGGEAMDCAAYPSAPSGRM